MSFNDTIKKSASTFLEAFVDLPIHLFAKHSACLISTQEQVEMSTLLLKTGSRWLCYSQAGKKEKGQLMGAVMKLIIFSVFTPCSHVAYDLYKIKTQKIKIPTWPMR